MAKEIRSFFKYTSLSLPQPQSSESDDSSSTKKARLEQCELTDVSSECIADGEKGADSAVAAEMSLSESVQTAFPEADIGRYVRSQKIDDSVKFRLLTEPYIPSEDYNFKADLPDKKRAFRYEWLSEYSPWLVYSPLLKGPLCLTCVLFPQSVQRGLQGSFITTVCAKYHVFNDSNSRRLQFVFEKQ